MDMVRTMLSQAALRGQAMTIPYCGALLPVEADYLMHNLPGAVLVDVRTRAEWQFVGSVPNAVCIEWRTWPGMQNNPAFAGQLTAQFPLSAILMFLCRSGARSDEAARFAMQLGYLAVYNVLEGFEGDKDEWGQRSSLNGWKKHGLPWVQG